jgi:hypothetical protein
MKNKGYYHWIHSLNEAALQSQKRGFEMLNEAKNYRPGQVERAPKQSTPQETAAAGVGRLIHDIGLMSPERAKRMAPQLFDAGRHIAERPGTDFPDNPVDDIGEIGQAPASGIKQEIATASAAKMRAATAAANAARSMGPVNAKPAGNAQAVEDDARDWEMADPVVHPPAQFSSPEQANAEVARLNAERRGASVETSSQDFERAQQVNAAKEAILKAKKAGKNTKAQREAGRQALSDYNAMRQRELSAEQPERYVEVEGGMLPMESISHKINKMLSEEDGRDTESAPRKQSDKPLERRARKPGKMQSTRMPGNLPGEGRTVGKGGVNFKALLDVYNNPGKYPPNISQAVQASFKDIFERGLGLPNS